MTLIALEKFQRKSRHSPILCTKGYVTEVRKIRVLFICHCEEGDFPDDRAASRVAPPERSHDPRSEADRADRADRTDRADRAEGL